MPSATVNSDPSWFGFCLTLRPDLPFDRQDLMIYLTDERKIATRLLFGGNLIRQPYMKDRTYRVVGSLDNSDTVMRQTFWTGVYPGLTDRHLDHVLASIHDFVAARLH
jgi:CDP-6-deoxy-D-xylo-4-hexulose-3-dehydrase